MSIAIDPLVPGGVLVAAAVAYTVLAYRLYHRIRPIVTPETWRRLVIGKVVSGLLLLLLLLNVSWTRTMPDTHAFRVIVLGDATGSMGSADCTDGRTRMQVLQSLIGPDAPLRQRLAARYSNLGVFVFANAQPRELPPAGAFDILPGETDIDGALAAILASDSRDAAIGAVLLLSDGLDNVGSPMQEVAGRFKKAGIPVHVVGIGDSRSRRDVGITWQTSPRETPRGEKFRMAATLTRNFTDSFSSEAILFEDGREVARQPVTFPAGERNTSVEFEHTAFTAGLKTYKVKVAGPAGEENVLNNIDFAGVSVRDPDRFRILYFSGSPDWEYRYLRRFAEDQERLSLDAILRLGDDAWFSHGITEQSLDGALPPEAVKEAAEVAAAAAAAGDLPADAPVNPLASATLDDETAVRGFPKPEVLNQYDALILNISGLYIMSTDDRANLLKFIDERGGGVLLCGDAPEIPADLQELLPVEALPRIPLPMDAAPLQFPYSRMFSGKRLTPVKELEGRLGVPAGSLVYRVSAEAVKPGAAVSVQAAGGKWPILVGQNYGAGRVAWLNLSDTWKWTMKNDSGADDHAAFWGYSLAWLSSSSRERMTIRPRPSKFSVGSEQTIKLDLLTSRYQPENAGKITCTVIRPGHPDEELQFIPSASQDGRYLGKFIAAETGEYRLRFKAETADGETLEQVTDYVVVDQSPESQPAPLAEPQLQNLSRATGADYWNYQQADGIDDLTLNKAVIQRTEVQWLRDRWWLLLLVAIGIIPDWYFRRKTGLR